MPPPSVPPPPSFLAPPPPSFPATAYFPATPSVPAPPPPSVLATSSPSLFFCPRAASFCSRPSFCPRLPFCPRRHPPFCHRPSAPAPSRAAGCSSPWLLSCALLSCEATCPCNVRRACHASFLPDASLLFFLLLMPRCMLYPALACARSAFRELFFVFLLRAVVSAASVAHPMVFRHMCCRCCRCLSCEVPRYRPASRSASCRCSRPASCSVTGLPMFLSCEVPCDRRARCSYPATCRCSSAPPSRHLDVPGP
jgi:hypothetical protein